MGFPETLQPIDNETVKRIKADHRFMDLAIAEAYLLLQRRQDLSQGDNISCPFHRDESPSGSIHQDTIMKGQGCWLFTCHGCKWNNSTPQRPKGSGDAIAVLRVASAHIGQPLSFQEACQQLLESFKQRHGNLPAVAQSIQAPPATPDPTELAKATNEMAAAQKLLMDSQELLNQLWTTRAIRQTTADRFGVGYTREETGDNYWCFPILDEANQLMVVKLHAHGDATRKSWWYPIECESW